MAHGTFQKTVICVFPPTIICFSNLVLGTKKPSTIAAPHGLIADRNQGLPAIFSSLDLNIGNCIGVHSLGIN